MGKGSATFKIDLLYQLLEKYKNQYELLENDCIEVKKEKELERKIIVERETCYKVIIFCYNSNLSPKYFFNTSLY